MRFTSYVNEKNENIQYVVCVAYIHDYEVLYLGTLLTYIWNMFEMFVS